MPSVDDLTFRILAERLDPPAPPPRILRPDWVKKYLPKSFSKPLGPQHYHLLSRLDTKPTGVRSFTAAFRGGGKTTTLCVGQPLEAIAQGSHRLIVLVKFNKSMAEEGLQIIRDELDRNPLLVNDWPSLEYVQKFAGRGRKTDKVDEILLRGGRILAFGAGEALRGLLRRDPVTGELVRPDLVLLDDLEDPEQVRSKLRTDRLEEWVFADVAGLAGPGAPLDILAIWNTIGPDALAVRALKGQGRFAGWDSASFPAEYIDEEGNRQPQWEGLPLEDLDHLLEPHNPDGTANEHFLGVSTYATEYLLDPRSREDTVFKEEWLKFGTAPPWEGLRHITGGVDPAASEKTTADYSACVWVGLDNKNNIWVKSVWRGRMSSKALMDSVEKDARKIGVTDSKVAYEAVGGFAWGVEMLRDRGLATSPVHPQHDKISRAQFAATRMEGGHILIDESLEDSEFVHELLAFGTGGHDDFVDAFVMAVKGCVGHRKPSTGKMKDARRSTRRR